MSPPRASLRILIVSYHFAPANESGTHRAIHFARSLHEAGHEVHVLAGHPMDADQIDESLTHVFPHPERVVRVLKEDSRPERLLAVLRSMQPKARAKHSVDIPSQNQSTEQHRARRTGLLVWPSKAFNAFEGFPDTHRGWYLPAVQAGRRLLREDSFDVIVASGPPWTALRVAARLSKSTNAQLALDFRDPWSWRTGGARQTSVLAGLAKQLERRVLDEADLLMFNSPALADTTRIRSSNIPIITVLNGSDVPCNEARHVLSSTSPLTFRHFGTLYGGRSLGPLLKVLGTADWPDGLSPTLEQFGSVSGAALLGAINVRVRSRPAVPFSEAVEEMSKPAILVVVQPDQFTHQIPTKIYDYLCTGNPILVLSSEQSAVWSLARKFDRCVRGDVADGAQLSCVVQNLLDKWRVDALFQVTAGDTHHLTKSALNAEFVAAIEELCSQSRKIE